MIFSSSVVKPALLDAFAIPSPNCLGQYAVRFLLSTKNLGVRQEHCALVCGESVLLGQGRLYRTWLAAKQWRLRDGHSRCSFDGFTVQVGGADPPSIRGLHQHANAFCLGRDSYRELQLSHKFCQVRWVLRGYGEDQSLHL